jgi:hypothetical protein
MIKISKYHLLPILVVIFLYLIGKETSAILFWTVFYVVIETLVLIKLIKNKYKSKIFFWLNILLFFTHFLGGLIMAYASLSMNVGSNSFIYK